MSLRQKPAQFSDLLGKTLRSVDVADDYVQFTTIDGNVYILQHFQSCCEDVHIDDVCGHVEDLIGSPITMAEESSNSDDPPKYEYAESHTWTFYRLATVKGYVTIRWYGSSNGYYSESVDFNEVYDDVR